SEFRHSTMPAVQQHGTNRFTFFIVEDQLRWEQIGAVIPAPGIGAVAKAAVHVELHLPACYCLWIGNRPLGIRDETSSPSCAARRLRILRSRRQDQNGAGDSGRQPTQSSSELASFVHSHLTYCWPALGRAMSWKSRFP